MTKIELVKYAFAFVVGVAFILLLAVWAEMISWIIEHTSKLSFTIGISIIAGIIAMFLLKWITPPNKL